MEPHPVDVHVGKRLRARRTILGMSQEEMGNSVGITFQQVQKYERGMNRIGSSRLYDFSCILGVGVSYFFEDLSGSGENLKLAEESSDFEHKKKFNNKEILSLVRSYYGITDVNVRKKVLSLIKSLSDAEVSSIPEEVTDSIKGGVVDI